MTDKEAYKVMRYLAKCRCYECPDECEGCEVGELREWLWAKTEREIDWTKVPKNTKVFVSDIGNAVWEKRYFDEYVPTSEFKFYTYGNGATSWSTNGSSVNWRYCKLAEEPKEEWYK